MKLDVTDRTLQKSDKELGVANFAFAAMNKARLNKRCHHWVNDIYIKLRAGYVQAGKKVSEMHLTNKVLHLLTVLDTDFVGHQQTATSFLRLAAHIPVFTADDELMSKLATESNRSIQC